jgi:hypothetical protein
MGMKLLPSKSRPKTRPTLSEFVSLHINFINVRHHAYTHIFIFTWIDLSTTTNSITVRVVFTGIQQYLHHRS